MIALVNDEYIKYLCSCFGCFRSEELRAESLSNAKSATQTATSGNLFDAMIRYGVTIRGSNGSFDDHATTTIESPARVVSGDSFKSIDLSSDV